jgi:hypothetical protein
MLVMFLLGERLLRTAHKRDALYAVAGMDKGFAPIAQVAGVEGI